jgi:hypothetical protein
MDTCQVCIETFNKTIHKKVECSYCEFASCVKCVKTYILNTKEDPHCMGCKKEWDREFLTSTFPKVFINKDLKLHRENILVERETGLLPEAQMMLEQELEIERLTKEYKEVDSEIDRLILKSNELKLKIKEMKNGKNIQKRQFIKKCSNGECRGFLSTQWKCGLCETYTCSECYEVKGTKNNAEHICNKENVETAKMIQKECRSCPKCATMIHKIDGCDLMWCVMCQTPFSWKTGKIEKGNIHNPHYFEWLKKNGREERNPLEVQCGRELDDYFLRQFNRNLYGSIQHGEYLDICQRLNHIKDIEIPKYQINMIEDNRDLRIAFLKNKITREEWKRLLQQREKRYQKKRNIMNLMAMYINACTDILFRINGNIEEKTESRNKILEQGVLEVNELRIYVVDHLDKLKDVYNMSIEKIIDMI